MPNYHGHLSSADRHALPDSLTEVLARLRRAERQINLLTSANAELRAELAELRAQHAGE